MSKPKRLHPIAMVIKIIKKIKEQLISLIVLLWAGYKGSGVGIWLFFIIPSAVFLIFIMVTSVLSWYRYTYALNDKELCIEYGILTRKKRYIPYERIQSLDVTEGILQRIFGLVKVQIETAGGNPLEGAEVVLSAISKQESQLIHAFFTEAKKGQLTTAGPVNQDNPATIYKISATPLLLLSLTSGRVGVAISAIFAFLSQFDNFIPYKRLYSDAERLIASSMMAAAVMILIGLFLIWIFAFIGMLLKYADFTVQKTEEDLMISQGLLARRKITIPLKRIQAVRISENIVRQLLGCATVYIESAGGSNVNKEGSRVMLLPLVKLDQVAPMINAALAEYNIVHSFEKAPKRAMIRYMIRSWLISVPIVAAAVLFFKEWGLLSLMLFAVMTCWAYFMYKDAGWNLEDQQLAFRYRWINRQTIFMKKNRIQCLRVYEGFFQRKKGLATIEAFLKSGMGGTGGKVTDLNMGDIRRIFSWYAAKKDG